MKKSHSSGPSPISRIGGGRPRITIILSIAASALAAAVLVALLVTPGSSRKTAKVAPEEETSGTNDSTGFSTIFPSLPSLPTLALPGASPRIPEGVDLKGELSLDVITQIAKNTTPTITELIERLHEAGEYTGIGAFNPPGTRPNLKGLAVPADFELPKGYVRHHQVTDDGQSVEAILMFDPDYHPVDAGNQPIALPEDRVVPPNMAPPGLPLRLIVIPLPVEEERL